METVDLLNKRLFAIKNQRLGGDVEELALVIGGYRRPSIANRFQTGEVSHSPWRRNARMFSWSSPSCARLSFAVSQFLRQDIPRSSSRPGVSAAESPGRQIGQTVHLCSAARHR